MSRSINPRTANHKPNKHEREAPRQTPKAFVPVKAKKTREQLDQMRKK